MRGHFWTGQRRTNLCEDTPGQDNARTKFVGNPYYIANNVVNNDKILSLNYSKLTNVPANPGNKISTLQVDADLNMNNRKVTSNAQVVTQNQLVPKSYISGEQLNPPIITSLVACLAFILGMM